MQFGRIKEAVEQLTLVAPEEVLIEVEHLGTALLAG
jgi:hypothetical protein